MTRQHTLSMRLGRALTACLVPIRYWPALVAGVLVAAGVTAAGTPYHLIYRFHGGTDGYQPQAAPTVDWSGALYGTTAYGGTSGACEGQAAQQGCGTVVQITPPRTGQARTETVLYRFQGGSDGAFPQASLLLDAAGNLYGTTWGGGNTQCSGGCGTVFELLRPATSGAAWTERVLYRFLGVPSGRGDGDAATPNGLVFDRAGNLDGMSYSGGHCVSNETGTTCYGAVFQLTPPTGGGTAWTERVLYRFHGPSGSPAGPVLDAAGTLYGVAVWGQYGYGMVFALTPPSAPGSSWAETTVHSFDGSDGAFPMPGLTVDQAGRLYGATMGSPAYNSSGTVYRLSPPAQPGGAWTSEVLYNFDSKSGIAGTTPNGNLVLSPAGMLYGTTQGGGGHLFGTVFALTPPASPARSWTESIVHSFAAEYDGAVPVGGLTAGPTGTLYGVTSAGGSNGSGQCLLYGNPASCGTVFQVAL